MAKTRSQTRKEATSKKKVLTKKLKPQATSNCSVQLKRLTETDFAQLMKAEDFVRFKKANEIPKKKYELRNRENVKKIESKPKKRFNQIVAMSQSALYTSKAIRLWDKLTENFVKSKGKLHVEQIVCGRMSGHRPWPAKVQSFGRNGVSLFFYGTNELGIVKKSEIIPYDLCKEVLQQYLNVPTSNMPIKTLNYHTLFIKACRELCPTNGN